MAKAKFVAESEPESETAIATVEANYENYGDVALHLGPDWSRGNVSTSPKFMLTTVGHRNGVADAYLTDAPRQKHQFRWCAVEDKDAISDLRTRHYKWCTRSTWTKNEELWEWDGDGYILHNGQRLMARHEQYYHADKEQLDLVTSQRDKKRSTDPEEEAALRQIERQGATIEDERGRQLKPLSSKH